mmetsp:Transcript_10713/g.24227  ORF Transcript_10713/g.24227 Transcript_10713/m.24227 type:complete len:212 (+) Transcript_10713:263-898(+)
MSSRCSLRKSGRARWFPNPVATCESVYDTPIMLHVPRNASPVAWSTPPTTRLFQRGSNLLRRLYMTRCRYANTSRGLSTTPSSRMTSLSLSSVRSLLMYWKSLISPPAPTSVVGAAGTILLIDLYLLVAPYAPSVSAAIMIPSLYLIASTDVPVTYGYVVCLFGAPGGALVIAASNASAPASNGACACGGATVNGIAPDAGASTALLLASW